MFDEEPVVVELVPLVLPVEEFPPVVVVELVVVSVVVVFV